MNDFINDSTITYRGTVYPWHCDHNGHMNVMWYTGKFDEATWHFLAGFGLTRSFLEGQERLMAAVEQHTVYKRELLAGNIVTIRSGILEIGEKIVRFFHEMKNEETGETAAVTELTGIYLDARTRRATPFPEDIVKRGRALALEHNRQPPAVSRSAGHNIVRFEAAGKK